MELFNITSVSYSSACFLRGDIFIANLDCSIGSEQDGTRPVVIVQNDVGNKHSPTVVVAAITSKVSKARLPTHIEVSAGTAGLVQNSCILLEQLRTIDKARLGKKLGSLNYSQLKSLNKALSISLGLF